MNMNTSQPDSKVIGHLPWVLTATCALVPAERRDCPEFQALSRAIIERDREAIALGLEILASHHADFLSEQQASRAYRLARAVRVRTNPLIRQLVMEIAHDAGESDLATYAA